MCPWAPRLLHILACAPVIALLATSSAPSARAQETAPPVPYVVAIDAGHGGAPDDTHPGQPFDSGAVGVNGLLEKDLTLDIARRTRALLEADRVNVAMTRDSDQFVSVAERSRIGEQGHAALFVSVHLNSWVDASVGGSLVLYPGPGPSQAFAAVMSRALATRLQTFGVESKGTELRDNWWIHATMPVVTVEGAYVTNPGEAVLLANPGFRQRMALAIHDGILAEDPAIARRKAEIVTWDAGHPGSPVGHAPAPSRATAPGLLPWVAVVGALGVATVNRRRLAAGVAGLAGLGLPGIPHGRRSRSPRHRRGPRGPVSVLSRPHSVYDDLWF